MWSGKHISEEEMESDFPPQINNSMNILNITELSPVREGKTQRKFRFVVDSRDKAYVFKAANESERDQWVAGMVKHKAQMKGVVTYLRTHS